MPVNRKTIRLKGYDYAQKGAYFVTICAHGHKCAFGDVQDGKMFLNDTGKIVEFTWRDLPRHNRNIELDEFIIMPNHMHGIIIIVGAGSKPALDGGAGLEPAPTKVRGHGLSEIVRQFKTFSAKRANLINKTSGICFWQRNYYEHVIRNETDLDRIREYVVNNPAGWEKDEYYAAEKFPLDKG